MGLFGRKPNEIYKDSLLKLEKELNIIKDTSHDAKTKFAICNAIVLIRGRAEQQFKGNKEQVNQIVNNVGVILDDIKACAAGGTYFNGEAFESTVLTKSVSMHVALLSQYMMTLSSSIGAAMSTEELGNARTGLKNRMKNESLDLSMDRTEKEIQDLEDEAIACEKRIREIEEIGRSQDLTSFEEDRLSREYGQLEVKLERLGDSIEPLKKVILKLGHQRTDNSRYEALITSVDKLKDAMTLKTYGSIEEFEAAAQNYMVVGAEMDAEHEFLNDSYAQTRETEEKEETKVRVSGFKKARLQFADKKQSEQQTAAEEAEENVGIELTNEK